MKINIIVFVTLVAAFSASTFLWSKVIISACLIINMLIIIEKYFINKDDRNNGN